jgi:hypothetical protein
MKPIIRYLIASTLVLFVGAGLNAQEKNKKKKQDSTYLQNKARADEQRNREEEEKRRNDSIKAANHRDSLARVRLNDSLKYDRPHRDSIYKAEQMRRQDSIDKSQPPMNRDKKAPPKNSAQCSVLSSQLAENSNHRILQERGCLSETRDFVIIPNFESSNFESSNNCIIVS